MGGMSDTTPPAPPPYSDHGPTPQRPITPGARVEIATDGLAMPKYTRGDALAPVGLVGDPPTMGWEVLLENGISMVYRASDLRVIDETPEQKHRRQRAEFLRGLTSDGPVSCGPLPRTPDGRFVAPSRTYTPPSCCGAFDEPDDSVTDDLRDLIASQSLAMATARTRQGVGYAAMTILAAAKGDEIGAAITRGLKRALGGLGDMLDGVDLDALVRQAMGTPAPQGAAAEETIAVGVQIDGVTVGTVLVPLAATGEQVVDVIRGEATLMAKIPADRNVVGVEYVPGKVVRITTAPVEAPTPAAE